jgi:RimJ/RimL family protein N-acetyltransferase
LRDIEAQENGGKHMSNQFELERKFKQNQENYPGHDYPLEFRPLKISDTVLLSPILRKHGTELSNYLADYSFAAKWNFRDANHYVRDLIDSDFPTYSYLFLIGKEIVGMAYIGGVDGSIYDVQIVLWVHPAHQGKRIGHNIGYTIKMLCLELWGFNSFNWFVAETNTASIKTAESLNLELHSTVTGAEIHARAETGDWRRYVAYRDESMKGILQGEQSLAAWTGNRNLSAIDAILQASAKGERDKARKLAMEELGIASDTAETVDDRNLFQKAIDQRGEELKRIGEKIRNKQGRMAYNEQLRRKRKKTGKA